MVLSDPTQESRSVVVQLLQQYREDSGVTTPHTSTNILCHIQHRSKLHLEKHYWCPPLSPVSFLCFFQSPHTESEGTPPQHPIAAQTPLLNSRRRELPLDRLPLHATGTEHKALNLSMLKTEHRCLPVFQPHLSSSL